MVLASEPLCICGCDVAAPNQIRRARQEPLAEFFKSFKSQFTAAEVRCVGQQGLLCCSKVGICGGAELAANSGLPELQECADGGRECSTGMCFLGCWVFSYRAQRKGACSLLLYEGCLTMHSLQQVPFFWNLIFAPG